MPCARCGGVTCCDLRAWTPRTHITRVCAAPTCLQVPIRAATHCPPTASASCLFEGPCCLRVPVCCSCVCLLPVCCSCVCCCVMVAACVAVAVAAPHAAAAHRRQPKLPSLSLLIPIAFGLRLGWSSTRRAESTRKCWQLPRQGVCCINQSRRHAWH